MLEYMGFLVIAIGACKEPTCEMYLLLFYILTVKLKKGKFGLFGEFPLSMKAKWVSLPDYSHSNGEGRECISYSSLKYQ